MFQTCDQSSPQYLWDNHKEAFCEDVLQRVRRENPCINVELTEVIQNEVLLILEDRVLQLGGKQLVEYGLPAPNRDQHGMAEEMMRETCYNLEYSQYFSCRE